MTATTTRKTTTHPSARPVATAQVPRAITPHPAWQALGLPQPQLGIGTGRCGCGACLEFFSNDNNFMRHRAEDPKTHLRRCLTPTEMRARGLEPNTQGVWVRAGTHPHAQPEL